MKALKVKSGKFAMRVSSLRISIDVTLLLILQLTFDPLAQLLKQPQTALKHCNLFAHLRIEHAQKVRHNTALKKSD